MYKWNAEDYHYNSPNQYKLANNLIEKLDLKGNEKILDIGCGDGRITAEIATSAPKASVIGIDNSEEMIGFAQAKFPTSSFPNLTFQNGDASNLNFNNEFDIIVSFACLHWVSDHRPVTAGIKSSLKPSGKILLQFASKNVADVLKSVGDKVITKDRWKNYFDDFSLPFSLYTANEYKYLIETVGLKPIRVEENLKELIFTDEIQLKAWIRTTWHPYTNRVPENLQLQLIDDLADTYIEINPINSDRLVIVAIKRIEVEATKE